jgi:sec-independent protein translocase protein TatB
VFDVGFWELLFIFTLALIVLGPDKLPALVSTLGRWTGRARALARGLRVQIEREMAADQTAWKPPPKSGNAKPPPAAAPQPHVPDPASEPPQPDPAAAAGAAFVPADDDQAGFPEAPPAAAEEPAMPGSGTASPDRRDER